MPRNVLILAPDTDPHAAAVAWALHRQGVETVWSPSLPAQPDARYAFHIDAGREALVGPTADGARFGAIWNRRLHDPEPVCAEADRAFVRWEWKLFQRNLFSLAGAYGEALWVNRLAAAQHAEHKLVQLSACRRLGLAFPDTVVTNDAAQVDALRRKWGRIVFKSFLIHQWEDRHSGKKYSVGVPLLDERSALPADAIAVSPGIYQRYIDKVCDVRVTVIGRHWFALSLRSAAHGAYVDWRSHGSDADLVAEPITLPDALAGKLRALMDDLGLVFGCIDLVMDRQGQFHFLEVNQAGQFLFVEELCPDYPVLKAMVALLASGRVDGDLDAFDDVTMAQFRASDDYVALKERADRATGKGPRPELFSLE